MKTPRLNETKKQYPQNKSTIPQKITTIHTKKKHNRSRNKQSIRKTIIHENTDNPEKQKTISATTPNHPPKITTIHNKN